MCGDDALYQGLTSPEILYIGKIKEDIRTKGVGTLVISVVAASISCSSRERSVKPGRACFACNFSSAVTTTIKKYSLRLRKGRTFRLSVSQNKLDLFGNVDPSERMSESNGRSEAHGTIVEAIPRRQSDDLRPKSGPAARHRPRRIP